MTAAPIATPYEDLLREVFEHGTPKGDRTGTGTRSLFGKQIRFDLAESFPLITTKRVHLRSRASALYSASREVRMPTASAPGTGGCGSKMPT